MPLKEYYPKTWKGNEQQTTNLTLEAVVHTKNTYTFI